MNPCAWCIRFTAGRAESCQFPDSDLCRTERRLEDLAHAINRPARANHYLTERTEDRYMDWTPVNGSLMMTRRQPSGYEYRIRQQDNGRALLIAEGRISDGKPPERREVCASTQAAVQLANQWERQLRA